MKFGHVIDYLKAGGRARREGWNGKGMFIAYQAPDAHSANTLPYIWMRTADGHRVPWLASQTDMLADDWHLLDSGECTRGDSLIELLGAAAPTPLLDDEQLEKLLSELPGERVTEDYIDSRIRSRRFLRITGTVTLCTIELDNGYSVRGESACVDPANYRREIGERIAHDNAYQKLWPLFGFLLAEARHRRQSLGANVRHGPPQAAGSEA